MTYQLANARIWDGSQWLIAKAPVGDNLASGSILELCRNWSQTAHLDRPARGGTLTINSVGLGSYDWVYKVGNQTVSTSDMAAWFTGSVDTRSAWVLVDGDLTINSGVLFTPPSRKLFTVVYVTGDAVINGTLSMTNRGANHSGTGISGGATTAGDIRIATGTFSTVVNPQVPAAGGAGGAAVAAGGNVQANGVTGSAGTTGGCGGGGSGGCFGTNATSGGGAAGSSFSGGAGGGGCVITTGATGVADSGGSDGGAGGDGLGIGNTGFGGGGGNPGGAGGSTGPGTSGTSGVLIFIVEGALSGSGIISADSVDNVSFFRSGGAAGGGSVTIMFGTDTSSITPTAAGGTSYAQVGIGGAGGAGTARKLAL